MLKPKATSLQTYTDGWGSSWAVSDRRLTEEKCDASVSLPMKGHLDSLNASVAAGIMMYHVFTSRNK